MWHCIKRGVGVGQALFWTGASGAQTWEVNFSPYALRYSLLLLDHLSFPAYPWPSNQTPARTNHTVMSPHSAMWPSSIFLCKDLWSQAGHPKGQRWILFSLGLFVCSCPTSCHRVGTPGFGEWKILRIGPRVYFVAAVSSFWLKTWEILKIHVMNSLDSAAFYCWYPGLSWLTSLDGNVQRWVGTAGQALLSLSAFWSDLYSKRCEPGGRAVIWGTKSESCRFPRLGESPLRLDLETWMTRFGWLHLKSPGELPDLFLTLCHLVLPLVCWLEYFRGKQRPYHLEK